MARLTVHHLGVSQSERVVWLCEELGLDYDLKVYDRDPVTRLAPVAYKALHPTGTAPVITDGDVVLGESGAIVDYILGRYGEGRLSVKPEAPSFANYCFWMHFANGSMVAGEMLQMIATVLAPSPEHPVLGFVGARREGAWALVEQRLGQEPFFAGDDFTAADIMMGFPLTTGRVFTPRDLGPYPNIRVWLARIGERPAYRSAMRKGDPNMAPLLT